MKERLAPFLDGRVPHLRIFRVMALMFPEAMTTVASTGALDRLARAMGSEGRLEPAARHVWVRERIDRVLPVVGDDAPALAIRMTTPWLLFERHVQRVATAEEPPVTDPDQGKLVPLSAGRRRKGLTATKGMFQSMLSTLEYVREGPTRTALLDFLRAASPDSKENSLGVTINSLQSEFAVIRAQGERYVLTERGEEVLESQDPTYLADWLLTRILGADKALVELRDKGPQDQKHLYATVRAMNPGWKSNFVPHSVIQWFRSLKVIDRSADGTYSLTEQGQAWASRIHWDPEPLVAEDGEPAEEGTGTTAIPPSEPDVLIRPDLAAIVASIGLVGRFPRNLVERLDAGLWSHARRHFAVLTGLSGSGKTLLAREYAKAITGNASETQMFTLPVQPGWYDPAPLLGFVNPLRGDSYVRTRFLDFLVSATADPGKPYVVILDELNLSHPEQYMAPLLSAMETGEAIHLHAEGDYFDGVPSILPYPNNLVLIGTVNMDETTHGLSDKVLDRAFVLEFWDINLAEYPRWGKRQIPAALEARAREVLEALMNALSPARLHFGWRVVDDVMSFLEQARSSGAALSDDEALDAVVYAKVLPKLRGEDAPRFRSALDACKASLEQFGLRQSAARVADLRRDVEASGSARFWR